MIIYFEEVTPWCWCVSKLEHGPCCLETAFSFFYIPSWWDAPISLIFHMIFPWIWVTTSHNLDKGQEIGWQIWVDFLVDLWTWPHCFSLVIYWWNKSWKILPGTGYWDKLLENWCRISIPLWNTSPSSSVFLWLLGVETTNLPWCHGEGNDVFAVQPVSPSPSPYTSQGKPEATEEGLSATFQPTCFFVEILVWRGNHIPWSPWRYTWQYSMAIEIIYLLNMFEWCRDLWFDGDSAKSGLEQWVKYGL